MNKKELIKFLSEEMGMSKAHTEVMFEEMFAAIGKALTDGKDVSIPRFGKFQISTSEARKGRNPKTGEEIDIPAKNRVKFKASKSLKDSVASS